MSLDKQVVNDYNKALKSITSSENFIKNQSSEYASRITLNVLNYRNPRLTGQ